MVEPWQKSDSIPFFLHNKYQFSRFTLLSAPCLLMRDMVEYENNPLTIAKHIKQIRQHWDGEIIFICNAISPYFRKRLVEQNIPFVIPGNQLYLPSMGINLREHYKKLRSSVLAISPSAQAVIIFALRFASDKSFTPSVLAKHLGYSRMTMTRAFDELEALEIGEVVYNGKERLFHLPDGRKGLWQHAGDLMRDPVMKRIWTKLPMTEWQWIPAGLTALASYSLLAPPSQPVYAMSSAEWREWKKMHSDVAEFAISEQDEHSCELELWSYSPKLFAVNGKVDQFSLYLSLKSQEDERVNSSLTDMMEQIIW